MVATATTDQPDTDSEQSLLRSEREACQRVDPALFGLYDYGAALVKVGVAQSWRAG